MYMALVIMASGVDRYRLESVLDELALAALIKFLTTIKGAQSLAALMG